MATQLQRALRTVKEIPQNVIRYISAAVTRIFGLNDDDYPATGVQPFEGDPPDERHS